MFDQLKGMASLAGLMKDLPRIQEKMEEVKRRLGERTVTAETGGGAVRATVSGALRVVSIDVDPALMGALVDASDEADRAMAADLVAGAVNAAITKARAVAEEELSTAAQELGLPLPGGGLGGLLSPA